MLQQRDRGKRNKNMLAGTSAHEREKDTKTTFNKIYFHD